MGWINADDILAPKALQMLFCIADISNIDWIHGYSSLIDTDGNEVSSAPIYYPQALLAAGAADGIFFPLFQQEGCFFRKRLWDAVGGCNEQFRLAGDWDLWRCMAAISSPVCLPSKMGSFRRRPGQLTENITAYHSGIDNIIPLKCRAQKIRTLAISRDFNILKLQTGRAVRCSLGLKARIRSFLLASGCATLVHSVQFILKILRIKRA